MAVVYGCTLLQKVICKHIYIHNTHTTYICIYVRYITEPIEVAASDTNNMDTRSILNMTELLARNPYNPLHLDPSTNEHLSRNPSSPRLCKPQLNAQESCSDSTFDCLLPHPCRTGGHLVPAISWAAWHPLHRPTPRAAVLDHGGDDNKTCQDYVDVLDHGDRCIVSCRNTF